MHRIDHATAVAEQPAQTAPGTPGYFSEGNPALGAQATVVTKDWANAIQEEVAHVIEAAGVELDKTDNSQLYAAVMALILANVGGEVPVASTTVVGIVELATSAETATGTDGTRAVTPAGAVATFCKRANNLSDVSSTTTARTNLGLGTAAVVNTGTAAGNVPTIAQGDARYARLGVANNFGAFEQTAASFNSTSAERFKRDIEPIDGARAIDMLRQVAFCSYLMRADGQASAGVIAEALAETELAFCVRYNADGQAESVNYQPLFAVAAAATLGLLARFEQLEAAIGAGGA